ncbi:hypothetical protein HPB47_011071, partial [Ixodes persulcatus]
DSLEFDTFKVNQGIAKYKNALKVLIPVRPHPKDKHEMPTNQAGLFSFISLVWLSKLMWKAYRQGIHQEDLWQMAPNDSAELNVKRLERLWKDEQLLQGEKAQFWMAAARFCKTRAIVAGVLICIGMTFQFLGPAVLLREILSFLEDSESGTSTGVLLALCLIGTQLVRSGCLSMSWIIGAHTAIRLQGAIQLLLYRRMLKVRIEDKHSGQVVNHVTNDMERIFDAAMNGMLMLGTPVMFLLTLVYSCCLIGPWALMGNFIILLFYPIMGGIAGIIAKLRRQAVKKTDARVHLMAEVVNNIRLIKMYAWELPFITKVADVRGGERSVLVRGNFLQSLSTTVTPVILIMATVSTLLGYGASGNELSASRAFTIFALFNGMGFSIGTLPYAIRAVTEAKVALQRMQKLLELDEAKMWSRKVDERDQRFAVTISDATFTWQSVPANVRSVDIVRERFKGLQSSKPKHGNVCNGDSSERTLLEEANGEPEEALRDISLHITKGSLIGICGRVGSGKTSLLNALCGEIGERGVTLSGGQRQRINLARALYSDRDIFLLDDPLSAVDSKVANQLFRKCIQTAMQGKTVFLVTHSMHVLEKCQQVLFMKGGRIIERGTHAALMSFPGEYRKMFQLDAAGKTQMALEGGAGVEGSMVGSRLVKDEEKAVGGISKGAVWQYVQACGGPCVVLLLALAFLAFVCSQMFANVWLQHWVDQMKKKEPLPNVTSTEPTILVGFGSQQNSSLYEEQIELPDSQSESYYYTVYGVTLPVMLFLGIIKGIACTIVLLAASSRLHNQMLQRVLRSPTSFFDVTPSGRITNRFSKDMDEMDIRIPFFLEMVVQSLLAIALQLLISVFVYKVFFVVLGAAAALYLLLDRWLNVGVREVKKLDNVARSSVVVHLSTTLQGISVIRVFDCHKWFTT